MDAITIVAIIGAASTLLSAGFAGWANLKQRRTEDVRLGYEAMRAALETYREDNRDLRTRIFTAEQHVVELTALVNRCESDKASLQIKMDALERRFDRDA